MTLPKNTVSIETNIKDSSLLALLGQGISEAAWECSIQNVQVRYVPYSRGGYGKVTVKVAWL